MVADLQEHRVEKPNRTMFSTSNEKPHRLLCAVLLAVAAAGQWPALAGAQCTGGSCPASAGGYPTSVPTAPEALGSHPPLPGGGAAPGAPHPAVARICCIERFGIRCYGSGTLIYSDAERAVVLSCAHLFGRTAERIVVAFPNGRQYTARLLAIDRQWDLAALAIDPPGVKPVELARSYPRPGQLLRSCGYGSAGRYWCNTGRVLGYTRTAATNTYETLVLSGLARDGDSGGPVFDQEGRLVGVLWGTDGRRVVGTYCGRLRQFLRRLLPSLPGVEAPQVPAQLPNAEPGESYPVPGGAVATPSPLDQIRRRLDTLAGQVSSASEQRDRQQRSLSERLTRLETALQLVDRLRQRVEQAEATVGKDNIRAVVREVALGVMADRAPGLLETVVPRLVAALGWTGPPSVALVLAARLLAGLIRRRVRRRRRSSSGPGRTSRSHRQGRASSPGRSPAAGEAPPVQSPQQPGTPARGASTSADPQTEAVLAREYDWELQQAEQASDGALAQFAGEVRRRVAERIRRIHGRLASLGESISGSR